MSVKRLLVVICALLIGLTLNAQEDLQEEQFLLTFIPNIQFAPMYVGIVDGHFANAGYEVTLEYLEEPDVVNLVAANQANFGVVSGEQVLLATAQDRPIVYVYEWFQQFPIGIVYAADRDINSAADLIGLNIGIPGYFGATYSGIITLLEAQGLSQTDVMLDEIGFAAPEVFCVGAIDASVIYINNEPLQIQSRAANGDCGAVSAVEVLPIGDIVDLVSNGIITNQTMLETEPQRVSDFLSAFDRGLSATINNPARAYLQSADFVETLPLDDDLRIALTELADQQDAFLADNPDRNAITDSRQAMYDSLLTQFDASTLLQFEVLLASIELWDTEQPGYSDAESWQNMQQTLISLGQLESTRDLTAIFSNAYLPQVDDAP